MRYTKIIATMGPSCVKYVEEIAEYVNGFRFNFSHDTHAEHRKRIERVRDIAEERNIALIADLSGPQIRTTNKREIWVEKGDEFYFNERIGSTIPFSDLIKEGDIILVDEGRFKFRVKEKKDGDFLVISESSGAIRPRRHINLPKELPISALTEKDLKDLEFIADQDFDIVAQSFVRNAEDVTILRNKLKDLGLDAKIIAKIEAFPSIKNLEQIIAKADGIMVARGDLGVEMAVEEVPILQKKIIRMAREHAKPVIVATHMLLSMTHSPVPSRAEASDIANAVFDGADAVMLSEETSIGEYPVEAVKFMDRIVRSAERIAARWRPKARNVKEVFAENALDIAESLKKEIIAPTLEGSTPLNLSRYRIRRKINVFTPKKKTAKFLSIVYGVRVFLYDYRPAFKNLDKLKSIAGVDRAIFVFGFPEGSEETAAIIYY